MIIKLVNKGISEQSSLCGEKSHASLHHGGNSEHLLSCRDGKYGVVF